MLETVRGNPQDEARGLGPRTRSHEVTELLVGVVEGIGAYDGRIVEAERDGDAELACFLRELRSQDLVRAKGAARLLRRPCAGPRGDERKGIGA